MTRLMSLFMAGSAVWAGSVASAYAADAADASASAAAASEDATSRSEEQRREDIIVTGTLIRGIAPAGTPTITVTQQNIQEAGGVTVQDVLAKIPQISFFNRQPTAGTEIGVGRQQQPQQPMIHGLPSLILLDGHRLASAGASAAQATSIDPSIIPTGVLGGIEVVPDGGSALYGSDAVGGVINMTTMRRFNGLKVDGNIGFADDYKQYRGNVTAGKDWGTGSIFASYSYTKSDALFGSSRPWIAMTSPIEACVPGTITYGANKFSFPGTGANGKPSSFTTGGQRCNRYTNESVLPEQRMHSVFAGLTQQLNSSISVDLRAFYSTRKTKSYRADPLTTNVTFAGALLANPYYTPVPGQAGNQRLDFSLQPAVGPNVLSTTKLDTWGVTGEFKANLFGDFQARLLGNYNENTYRSNSIDGVDTALLTAAIGDGRLNPYNAAYNAASTLVAQQIANRPTTDQGAVQQTQIRLVADGSLFQIGGGDVKIAVGGELLYEHFDALKQTRNYLGAAVAGQADQAFSGSRTVTSLFGELEVPLISPESGGPIHELRLSAAGRYDHYSDFGNTFNPRFAATLAPVEWLTFRGTYGKSFVAPSLPQLFSPQGITQSNFFLVLPPGVTNILVLTGGNPTLKPQKATTWSLGFDVKAPFLEGLRASLTYYNAVFKNRILGAPPITSPSSLYTPTYSGFYIQNPTQQQVLDFVGGPATFAGLANCPTLASLYDASGTCPAASRNPGYVTSTRSGNIGTVKTSGFDFNVNYTQPTSFGSLDFGVGGNYILKSSSSANDVIFVDDLLTTTHFSGTASIGANIGNFRATATLLHTGGFGLNPNLTGQTRVDAYNTVDTFMSYTFKQDGYLADTVVSLQVTNLLNVRPPVNLTVATGYGSGNILGRTFQLGVSKKF